MTEQINSTQFMGEVSFPNKALSQQIDISPRNTNASCISAITFDSSMTLSKTSHGETNYQSKDTKNVGGPPLEAQSEDKNSHNDTSPHNKESIKSHTRNKSHDMKHTPCDRGSLYSRIMTRFQEDTDNETAEKNGTLRNIRIISSDLEVNLSSPDQILNKYEKPDDEVESVHFHEDAEDESIIEEIQVEEEVETTPVHVDGGDIAIQIETDEVLSVVSADHIPTQLFRERSEDKPEQGMDQWREVFDENTGKTYYYNRRTRESSWHLPSNGNLVEKRRYVRNDALNNPQSSSISVHEVSMGGMSEDSVAFQQELYDADMSDQNTFSQSTDTSVNTDPQISLNRDQTQNTLRRREKFFPDDATQSNTMCKMKNDDGVAGTPSSHQRRAGSLRIDDDDGPCLFCMYCGASIDDANAMKKHLHFHCPKYSDYKTHKRTEHERLRLNLKHIWNEIGGDKENQPPPNKCVISACDSYTTRSTCSQSVDIFSTSDDEETILDGAIHKQYQKSFQERSMYSQVPSTCAFCFKTFRSGNTLSKHLLVCRKRQASNKKRVKKALHPLDTTTNKSGGIRTIER
jgi:hypothetical protein